MNEKKSTVIPKGTTLTVYSKPGASITDDLGIAIEENQPLADVYKKVYKAGDATPQLVLLAPDADVTLSNTSRTVDRPTILDDLLTEDMGDCHWAACTHDRMSPNKDLIFHTDGVYKKAPDGFYKQSGDDWIRLEE